VKGDATQARRAPGTFPLSLQLLRKNGTFIENCTMDLRSIFRSDRLSPEWTYTADGMLWRLFCARGGRLVGECRDQEKKTATFFCWTSAPDYRCGKT